jgi:hypothetical protein
VAAGKRERVVAATDMDLEVKRRQRKCGLQSQTAKQKSKRNKTNKIK